MKTLNERKAAFKKATGMSWEDAVEMTIDREREAMLAEKNDAEKAAFLKETGWTWEAAVDEALLVREAELLRNGPEGVETGDEPEDDFEAITGWTRADAFDEAVLARSEAMWFGTRANGFCSAVA